MKKNGSVSENTHFYFPHLALALDGHPLLLELGVGGLGT